MGWVFDYPAMENYLGPLYTTRGSSNYYGYSNPEFDRLVAQGDRAATPEEATRFYQQAEDLLARDLPVLPLRYLPNTYGFSTRVRNVRLDPFEHPDLYVIEVIPTP
jgi:peptide/nickel transport system substrate-binding protein/oligopeptide transport system substrate-binding protein